MRIYNITLGFAIRPLIKRRVTLGVHSVFQSSATNRRMKLKGNGVQTRINQHYMDLLQSTIPTWAHELRSIKKFTSCNANPKGIFTVIIKQVLSKLQADASETTEEGKKVFSMSIMLVVLVINWLRNALRN